ncbi:response regulator transcription factor [Cohnella terricola]|uniref:Helix-turn-helix domain-containing protein n=1 Tax=Cohnella terricola TaxID=1289167 RepID=A0A559JFE5_9BACL|nr:helix-turn-helix domain-containing protein [Cohnella terricola]TVX98604.1 helix-turn-helix domain-containing protein [Cohnella terricola]
MYRVIVVDDDVAVLEFLEKLIPWQEIGFELTGAFTNAFDAIDHCGTAIPDLIVTDIGMPEMDGLELIRKLRSEAQATQFVILSCHDEFHYAQQAVKLGVQDYILKETLSVESIMGIAEQTKSKIDDSLRHRHEMEKLTDQAQKSKAVRKEKWFRNLMLNPVTEDGSMMEQLREYGLNPNLGHYIPVLWRIHSFNAAINRYEKEDIVKFIVENAAEELLCEEPDVVFFSYSAQEFCLIYAFKKDLASNPYDKLVRVSRMLQQAFSKYLKLEFSAIVGETAANGAEIRRQLPDLLSNADQFFYFDEPKIVRSKEIPPITNQEDLFMHYFEYSERLNRLLLEENRNVEQVVDSFIQFIKSRRFQPSNVKQMVWKLALDMQLKLIFSQEYAKEKAQQSIERMLNVNEIRNWLLQFMKEAVLRAEQISKKSKKTEIVDAQKYVMLHLDRKITLEEVADRLHLNPSYFSRLFKKETGENFIEFVTRMKMEKAKALIGESGNTVEKVAWMLGYDNKSYFIKVFKQHFGASPSQFA